jgi:glycosyltransferase involved in cell wall biosynthesis
MPTVLFVSNVGPGDPGGRAEKLTSRARDLEAEGFDIVWATVDEPYVKTFLPSLIGALRTAHREGVDFVTSVSNPFHLQLIGFAVATLLWLPWVVEFRDPMVTSPDRDPDALVTKAAAFVEWIAVNRATRIVWGDGIQIDDDYFEHRYGVGHKETCLPYHGYDPEKFDPVEPAAYDDITITYAGSFYEGWIEPYRFLNGLERHVEVAGGDGLTVQFYGDWNEDYQAAVNAAGLTDVVETHEFVPHKEIVPVLKGSDLLLYIGGDDPQNRLNVPSKIWDYVGAGVPILAVVDPSFRVAELIERYDAGTVVDPDNTKAISEVIAAVREGTYEYDPDPELFEFTRDRKLTALADIYRGVAT